MAVGRRRARREALFLLYQHDLMQRPVDEHVLAQYDDFTAELVRGVQNRTGELDPILGGHLEGWDLSRLGYLERAILRMATYELMVETAVPATVILSEAVELAKRYCAEEGRVLVNGVLGALAEELRPGEGAH